MVLEGWGHGLCLGWVGSWVVYRTGWCHWLCLGQGGVMGYV